MGRIHELVAAFRNTFSAQARHVRKDVPIFGRAAVPHGPTSTGVVILSGVCFTYWWLESVEKTTRSSGYVSNAWEPEPAPVPQFKPLFRLDSWESFDTESQ